MIHTALRRPNDWAGADAHLYWAATPGHLPHFPMGNRGDMKMNFRNLIALAVFVMALVFCAPCGWAQSSGNLQGTVKDASGGILVGATVGITDPATGYHRDATTGADGSFRFTNI